MDRPFRSRDEYLEHEAIGVRASEYLESFLRSVVPLSMAKRHIGEWFVSETNPERLWVSVMSQSHEDDDQILTATAVLWADDPRAEHERVRSEFDEEWRRKRDEADKYIRRYEVVACGDEEEERAALRRLLKKYPDEGGGLPP